MNSGPAIEVTSLTHCYRARTALRDVSFVVERGEVFAFLGPNGGGKTTLFRLLATLMPPQSGEVRILGQDCLTRRNAVRALLGVVFQSNSLDKKLTVDENIALQAVLYGLHGRELHERRNDVLEQLGLSLHRKERVETLSGGMRRRVDLAKTLIHRPAVLLLDEPSAGLDPGARSDLWRYLRQLKAEHGMTLVLTSHLLEEADRADRVAILHQGRIVAVDDPGRLRSELGGDSITIETDEPEAFCETLNRRWNCGARVVEREIRFASPKGAGWWSTLRDEYPTYVKSIKLGSPTLEDVFIQRTGHQFWQESATRKVR